MENYREIIINLKEVSGMTWSTLAKLLGYSKGQKIMDIARGQEGMGTPSQKALEYFSQSFSDRTPLYIRDTEWVFRTRYPRFIARKNIEKWEILQWIDDPLDSDTELLLSEI